jgi:hypothetical protein
MILREACGRYCTVSGMHFEAYLERYLNIVTVGSIREA